MLPLPQIESNQKPLLIHTVHEDDKTGVIEIEEGLPRGMERITPGGRKMDYKGIESV